MESRHPHSTSVTTHTLPSFSHLVYDFDKLKKDELDHHGVENISDLPYQRAVQMQLMDSIIYYLNNLEILDDREGSLSLPTSDDAKRDILAGVMFHVKEKIHNSYGFPYNLVQSPENSLVFTKLKECLSGFDKENEKKALQSFVNFFIQFDVANLVVSKSVSLTGIYSTKQLIADYPKEIGNKILSDAKKKLATGVRRPGLFTPPAAPQSKIDETPVTPRPH